MTAITKTCLSLGILIFFYSSIEANSGYGSIVDDDNIVIKNAVEKYEFVTGKGANPVLINKQSTITFRCDGYRTNIPFVEFYNDQSTINDLSVYVSGKKAKGIQPVFEYYSVNDIFYSDARICYVTVPLEKKGAESEVRFNKTINDPRYFTSIYLSESYKIENKEITIVVPDWMHLDIKEMNFEGFNIKKDVSRKNNSTIYTYVVTQLPPRENEANSPGPTYIYPHLLMLCHYAEPKGQKVTYFNSINDQYAWYKSLVDQIGNDRAVISQKAAEIIKGISNDTAKVKAIYKYVQDNIRYIAFEDGIAGFKPEKAQEVLRKNYGDCKGMANLTKELLVAAGFDARLCWIGTNHIAYDYSTPSLSVDNHMICAINYKGTFHFLDATETYIGFDQYAERIQGRQVLIENGDQFILQKIPLRSPAQNTNIEKRILTLNGNDLTGTVTHKLIGESKEWLITKLHSLKKDKLSNALQSYLSENNSKYQISQLETSDLTDRNNELSVKYDLDYKDAAPGFGNEIYVDLDFRKEMSDAKIDLEKRKLDILFPYKQDDICETELTIPQGYKINGLPAGLHVDEPGYSFKIDYKISGEKLIYRKEIMIKDVRMRKSSFKKWNDHIQQLNNSYKEQITLTKK